MVGVMTAPGTLVATMSLAMVGLAGVVAASRESSSSSAFVVSPRCTSSKQDEHCQAAQGSRRFIAVRAGSRLSNEKSGRIAPPVKESSLTSSWLIMGLWGGRGRRDGEDSGNNPQGGKKSSGGVSGDGSVVEEAMERVAQRSREGKKGGRGEPKQQITRAEAARQRIKRARGALEDALDELGQNALGDLGLSPPAYMDLHLPSGPGVVARDEEKEEIEGKEEGVVKKRRRKDDGWLGQLSQPDTALDGLGEAIEEAIEDGIVALEEGLDAFGEGISSLDDRVERARASVETALNELGLAVPLSREQRGADGDEGGSSSSPSDSKGGVSSVFRRRWLPERIRAALDELSLQGMDASSVDVNDTTTAYGDIRVANATTALNVGQRIFFGAGKKSGMFLRRSFPSIQSAERAVKRTKDALGTVMDDVGLTPPPVGSALERFLHADELLGLWRQEEEVEDRMEDRDDILPGTDIGLPERKIWVVTTAALPWMTGTSVNPLLRAAYLSRGREKGKVSLMIPWLGLEDQEFVLPEGKRFDKQEEQEAYIRDWLRNAGMKQEADDLQIAWYEARYHQIAGCIFPMGDITRIIPDEEADVCIMEEPEHLNWFRATGANWSKKFTHVVGVIHTNYVHYTMADRVHWASGRVKAPFARAFNKIMARAYCDKVIKLSATLQKFAEEKETVTNVHGVRENFLLIGDARAKAAANGVPFAKGPYFLGKMLWEKGYGKLWDLLKGFEEAEGGEPVAMAAYGSGPDRDPIHAKAAETGLNVTFFPATDHAQLGDYKIFVNPSQSEVLCTTVAEALAMGKFAIIAEHASNEFFYQFPNALKFKDQEEFNEQLKYAMANEPVPLTPEQRHVLGWDAATDRLVESAKVTVRESRRRRRELDEAAWLFHYYLGSGKRGDRLRKIMAGGVVAGQNAHMESLLREEEEARKEAARLIAAGDEMSAKEREAETSGYASG